MTLQTSSQQIGADRRRYEELKRAGQDLAPVSLPPLSDRNTPVGAVRERETVPGGWYWSCRLKRGESLRLAVGEPPSSISVLAWNAHDTSERYNAGDTVKVQWTADIRRGRVLLSDMGRVLLALTEDSYGRHDAIVGGSTPAGNKRKYGASSLRSARESFVLAAAKHGLGRVDVTPCITFFAPVITDSDGRLVWQGPPPQPGDFVDLRAEMDTIVAIANCPHPLDPRLAYEPGAIEVQIHQPVSPKENDPCRNAGPESVRAYENTARYLAQLSA